MQCKNHLLLKNDSIWIDDNLQSNYNLCLVSKLICLLNGLKQKCRWNHRFSFLLSFRHKIDLHLIRHKKSYQLCLYHLKMKSCLYRLSLESIDINDAICTFSKLFRNGKTFHGLNFFEEKLDRERVCDDSFVASWKFNIETFEKCWKWGWNGTQTRQLGDKSMWWSEEIVA